MEQKMSKKPVKTTMSKELQLLRESQLKSKNRVINLLIVWLVGVVPAFYSHQVYLNWNDMATYDRSVYLILPIIWLVLSIVLGRAMYELSASTKKLRQAGGEPIREDYEDD